MDAMYIPKVLGGQVTVAQDAIIFGVETHVCVQQTALDLMDRGIQAQESVE